MFDDVSSDDDSQPSDAAVAAASSAVPAHHAEPSGIRASGGASRNNKAESIITSEHAEADPTVFVPKSASASQARAEPEGGNGEEEEREQQAGSAAAKNNHNTAGDDGPAATMVTRVEVSPPPKESTVTKSAPADPLKASTTSRTLRVTAGTTPAKAPASSYSTPATVSKRPAEREEQEAAEHQHQQQQNAPAASSVRKDNKPAAGQSAKEHGSASATKASRYKEREALDGSPQPEEDVAFSTVANPNESRTRRATTQQREEMDTMHSPYSTSSRRKKTAQQLEFSREEPHDEQTDCTGLLHRQQTTDDDDESEVEDFPFSTYVFPRLDPALADYHGSRTAVGAAKRGEECPPNACERSLAYLMVTDIRMAVYLGVLFLATVFEVVSIPTSQLDMVGKACYTYWGFKSDCDSATYTYSRTLIPSSATRSRLGAGAAFSIITLVLYVVNFTATLVAICCVKEAPHKISLTSRVVVATLGFITVVMQLISWAVIAGIHSSHYDLDKGVLAFGVGFGLNLTSWILNFLGALLVVAVPSRLVNRHQRAY